MSEEILASIQRKTRENNQGTLFDIEPDWRESWWGMPDLTVGDARPSRKITVSFMCDEDVKEFAQKLGIRTTSETNSIWYPEQTKTPGSYAFYSEPKPTRYPICIPSKGRPDNQTTGKLLDKMGVSYWFFVESDEYEDYCKHLGKDKVVSMPFNNLGQGSIPARNFIWEWAKERGHKRHWTLDDNIKHFVRLQNNRRIVADCAGVLQAIEDFVDRYENIVMAGPHNRCFDGGDRSPNKRGFRLNSRVYSCILLDTSMPDRWRGRYNEDTDLSLRLLKQGKCTALFCSLLMDKAQTACAKGGAAMKGGNTDNVYNGGDHRLAFAQSLADQHPDCVKVTWKFNRWHHEVDYSKFKGNKPILKAGITPRVGADEYGMRLVRVKS
jgi:hypothetical protein